MTKIEQALTDAGTLPVLFNSDPFGDVFEFGTLENLENEFKAFKETGEADAIELTTADELLNRLDFEVYENNEPIIVRR